MFFTYQGISFSSSPRLDIRGEGQEGGASFLLGVFLYGLVLEMAQIYVPERYFSGVDILLNLLGSCVGAFFHWSSWPEGLRFRCLPLDHTRTGREKDLKEFMLDYMLRETERVYREILSSL